MLCVTVLPPKAAHVWEFLPEGAQKMQTLLKLKAEGESAFKGWNKFRKVVQGFSKVFVHGFLYNCQFLS